MLGNRNLCSFSCLLRDSLGHRSCWAMGKRCLLCRCCLHAAPLHVSPGLAWRSCGASCLHLSLLCFCPFLLFTPVTTPHPVLFFSLPSLSSSQLPSQCGELHYVDLFFGGSLGAQPLTQCPPMLVTLRVSISVSSIPLTTYGALCEARAWKA